MKMKRFLQVILIVTMLCALSAAAMAAVPTLIPAVKKVVDDSNSAITALTTTFNDGVKAGKITAADAAQFKQLLDSLKTKVTTATALSEAIANDVAAAKVALDKMLISAVSTLAPAIKKVVDDGNLAITALTTTYSDGVKAGKIAAAEATQFKQLLDTLKTKTAAAAADGKVTLAEAQAIANDIAAAKITLAQMLAVPAASAALVAKSVPPPPLAALGAKLPTPPTRPTLPTPAAPVAKSATPAAPATADAIKKAVADNNSAITALITAYNDGGKAGKITVTEATQFKQVVDALKAKSTAASADGNITMPEVQAIATDIAAAKVTLDKMLAAYIPPVPPACTPGMAGAAICDLNARGYESCKSSKSASEFSTCGANFIATTPRNCTLSSAADRPACEAYNKSKFPAAAPAASAAPVAKPVVPATTAAPVAEPVVRVKTAPVAPAYNPPAARKCTPGMASAAICDLEARANASCRSSKSASEFSTCTANFIATTPRNCALSSKADQAACNAYNKKTFGR